MPNRLYTKVMLHIHRHRTNAITQVVSRILYKRKLSYNLIRTFENPLDYYTPQKLYKRVSCISLSTSLFYPDLQQSVCIERLNCDAVSAANYGYMMSLNVGL